MIWMRFLHDGRPGFGTVQGDAVQVHEGDMFHAPWPTGEVLPLVDVQWLPPVLSPRLVLGLWNNFRASAVKNGWAEPAEPLYFLKSPGCVVAHDALIPVPDAASYDGRVVYEGELALVIGRTTSAVSEADAPAHIFGVTLANDVTAMELLHRDASFTAWTRAKSFDGFCPLGPVIVTDFAIGEATALRTLVGGRERQNYLLSDMFFSPAAVVSHISRSLTLEAGDVILCGTSLGVLPMKPGTRVEVVVDGIGTLANTYGPAAA